MSNLKIVIMCGGNGTRLWPYLENFSKQFLKLTGDLTMFQLSCENAMHLDPTQLVIVCNEKHHFIIQKQLQELSIRNYIIVSEPSGKDTCAAIATSTLICNENDNILVMTADHVWDKESFKESVLDGFKNLQGTNQIGFLGITPTHPEIGYGYIKVKDVGIKKIVTEFKEKPNIELAKKYVKDKSYFWNSGVFLFNRNTMLQNLKKYQKDILKNVELTIKNSKKSNNILKLNKDFFTKVEAVSIDYAIMEHQKEGLLVPYNNYWCDIGSFNAMFKHCEKDDNNCVLDNNVINIDSKDCLVMSENRKIGIIGCNNLAVIDTRDALLVCNKDKTQKVKDLVKILKKNNSHLPEYHTKVYRPWGWYINVEGSDDGGFKVKRIGVYPGKRLSLQSHYKRSEHWVIVKGKAKVQVGKDFQILHPNQHVYIPKETLHRMENIGEDLVEFVETQIGEYLGEEDIVRYQDDFGRV